MDRSVRVEARNTFRATHKTVVKTSLTFDSINVPILIGRHSRVSPITGCLTTKHRIPVSSTVCQEANASTTDTKQRLLMVHDAMIIQMTSVSMDNVR